MLPELTLAELKTSATHFAHILHTTSVPELYGATDGKAVGTFVEQLFRQYLAERYTFIPGNAANGIDLPGLEVDLKATSYKQPQSSCPFRNASQGDYYSSSRQCRRGREYLCLKISATFKRLNSSLKR